MASLKAARAESDALVATTADPPPRHANPRFKATYRAFSLAGLNGKSMWLDGAQIDVYPLSRRWIRAGFETEGGTGATSLQGAPTAVAYGLFGLTAGFQYPARVTPFVEGRFAGGVLSGTVEGALTVGGSTYGDGAVLTYLYGGGIEGGVEVYILGRSYLSAAVGWMRASWHGLDVAEMMANPQGGMAYKDLKSDCFTFKVGIGI